MCELAVCCAAISASVPVSSYVYFDWSGLIPQLCVRDKFCTAIGIPVVLCLFVFCVLVTAGKKKILGLFRSVPRVRDQDSSP